MHFKFAFAAVVTTLTIETLVTAVTAKTALLTEDASDS